VDGLDRLRQYPLSVVFYPVFMELRTMNAKAATATTAAPKMTQADFIRQCFAEKITETADIIAAGLKANPPIEIKAGSIAALRTTTGGSKKKKAKTAAAPAPTLVEVLSLLKEAGGVGEIAKAIKTIEGAKTAQALIDKLGGEKAATEIAELLKATK
jgi:hypothetical protein